MKFSNHPSMMELVFGLTQLTFNDNFAGFTLEDQEIGAGEEVQIINRLPMSKVPKYYLILSQTGAGQVTKGTSTWTGDYVYLINNGGSAVTVTVIFFGE